VKELKVFFDGSVHTVSGIGYGAYLVVKEPVPAFDVLRQKVNIRKFEDTSSSKLELQTLLWALNDIVTTRNKLIIYTDSQNIMRLNERRSRLEHSDFQSKKNEPLKHAALYKEFYHIMDQLDCQFIQVKGHQKSLHKNDVDHLFTLVDRASRRALRLDKL